MPYEHWDAATLAARLPGLDGGRYWTPDAGYVNDPMLAAVNLADAARQAGAEFQFKAEVSAVRTAGDRVSGIDLADGRRIDADLRARPPSRSMRVSH